MSKQAQVFTLKIVGLISIIYSLPFLKNIADAYAIKSTQIFESKTEQAQMFFIAITSAITPVVILILSGIILIVFSEKIVSYLSPNPTEQDEKTDPSNFQSVAISIIGIALVAFSIPDIAQIFLHYRFLVEAGDQLPYESFSIGTKAEFIAKIIQLLIGLTLFFGSKGFSSLWYFFQKARPMSKINTDT